MAYREEEIVENGITYIIRYDKKGKQYAKFIKPEPTNEPEPVTPEPTQLDRIEEQQLIIMEAQADQYEQDLQNRINDMEVQATMYEAILALGGEI